MDLTAYLADAQRGTAAAIARMLSVHPVMLSQWASCAKPVPDARCPDVERASGGKVTCEELRPDVRWIRVPDAAWPHPEGRPCIDVAAPELAAPTKAAA